VAAELDFPGEVALEDGTDVFSAEEDAKDEVSTVREDLTIGSTTTTAVAAAAEEEEEEKEDITSFAIGAVWCFSLTDSGSG
jgi:uncharacterized tellurite resistance protein B-like protein